MKHTAEELLAFLLDWTFAQRGDEGHSIYLQPALGRLAGDYPQDYRSKQQTKTDSEDEHDDAKVTAAIERLKEDND